MEVKQWSNDREKDFVQESIVSSFDILLMAYSRSAESLEALRGHKPSIAIQS